MNKFLCKQNNFYAPKFALIKNECKNFLLIFNKFKISYFSTKLSKNTLQPILVQDMNLVHEKCHKNKTMHNFVILVHLNSLGTVNCKTLSYLG